MKLSSDRADDSLKRGQHQKVGSEQVFRQIKIIIIAMIAGLVSFAGVTIFLVRAGAIAEPQLATPFAWALAVLAAGSAVVSGVASRLLAKRAAGPAAHSAAGDSTTSGHRAYLGIKILRAALTEGFGLCGTVFLLVTGNWYLLAAPLLAIWILVRLLPRASDLGSRPHAAIDP